MKKPIAVLISDVHYSLNTLSLADTAFRAAIDKAAELGIPLFDLGDITNDKAILRAEAVNALIETMEYAQHKGVDINLIVGNHSLINEKSEGHALNFLHAYVRSITNSATEHNGVHLIPYNCNQDAFVESFKSVPKGSLVFTHQGYKGAAMGDYVQDRSSVDPVLLKDYRIFSGHYHRHQTIGTVTYVGNPYTLTFGEANDGPKGFLVLYDDWTFTREILNLRKHIILEVTPETIGPMPGLNPDDLLWLKVKGSEEELRKLNKAKIGNVLLGHSNFKLDLIYTDSKPLESKADNMSGEQLLDSLIETQTDNVAELKSLWRALK